MNNRERILRWIWYFTGARVIDAAIVGIIGLYIPLWYLFIRGRFGIFVKPLPRILPTDLIIKGPKDPLRDIFSESDDHHGLMVQVGHGFFHPEVADKMAEKAIRSNGSFRRSVFYDYDESDPSVDVAAAWLYFYKVTGIHRPDLVKRVAEHFLSNVFNVQTKDGAQSIRFAGAGLTWSTSKEGHMTPPAWFDVPIVSAALLHLAAQELGGKWKWIFWMYYLFSFVWFWERFPYLGKYYGYPSHISQMGLYVLHKTGHNERMGLRWNAVTCKTGQGIQPFIGGMAAECGVLSKEEEMEALNNLLASNVQWPQYFPLINDRATVCHSMMAHCCMQLNLQAIEN